MTITKKLKDHRLNRGYTQSDLADKLNVSRQTISNWETGKSLPDIYSLVELSNLYNISLDKLIKEDIDMMKTIKKEKNVKGMVNKVIYLCISGVSLFGISFLLSFNSNIQDFVRGMGFGILIASGLIFLIISIVSKISKIS